MDKNTIKIKKAFEEPKLEIVVFNREDIISTSGGFDGEWDTSFAE